MKVTIGDLKTELPDGWIDGSIIQFADPSRPAAQGSAQPSVVITRAGYSGEPLDAIFEAHKEQLQDALVGFTVKSTGAIEGAEREVQYMEHVFGEAGEFAQILLLTVIDSTVYIVTGTSNAADFADLRESFVKAATALQA